MDENMKAVIAEVLGHFLLETTSGPVAVTPVGDSHAEVQGAMVVALTGVQAHRCGVRDGFLGDQIPKAATALRVLEAELTEELPSAARKALNRVDMAWDMVYAELHRS